MIPSVLPQQLALISAVWILVPKPIHALAMQNVALKTIDQFVLVQLDGEEILRYNAINPSVNWIQTVLMIRPALMKTVSIPAFMEIFAVALLPNVRHKIIELSAFVLLVHRVIHLSPALLVTVNTMKTVLIMRLAIV